MKFKAGNKIYDPEKEPVMIIFDNDVERLTFTDRILSMPAKDGERKYCIYPEDMPDKKVKKFMEI